jgi:NADH:ubiquinone oxidoreductase subunit 2 (subunit N)
VSPTALDEQLSGGEGEQALLTDKYSTDYSLVVLFSSLGSSLLISSYDLISVYLSIELQSFGLYVLSTLYRDSESSTKAGLKYFLLGGLSSCIILLGTGIIYSYTGTTNLESLYIINSVIDVLPSSPALARSPRVAVGVAGGSNAAEQV